MDTEALRKQPRADSYTIKRNHNKWGLHAFAFAVEDERDWMPARLRKYHPGRVVDGELMEGYYDEFIPVAYETDRGMMLKKDVQYKTTYCPDCEVAARKDELGESVCPECGLICTDTTSTDNLVRDPKAAGRVI